MPLVVSLLALLVVAAAGWWQTTTLQGRIGALEQRIAGSEGAGGDGSRLDGVEAQVKTLSESFFNQATDLSQLKQERDRLRKTNVDLDEKTFARVDTQLGPLFIQAEAVRRRPDDTAVDLLIGNPTSATLVDTTLHTRWGRAFEPSQDFQLWQDALKGKDFTIDQPLRPGSWNRYTLRLETGPVTQLGFLEISFDAKTVQLLEVTTTTLTKTRPTTTTTRPRPRPRPTEPRATAADDDAASPEPDLLDAPSAPKNKGAKVGSPPSAPKRPKKPAAKPKPAPPLPPPAQ